MGIKIAFSGMVLATLLLLPYITKGTNPPLWFMAVIMAAGFAGVAMVFGGILLAIWGDL